MEVAAQIGQLLNDTVSPDCVAVRTATEALDRLSHLPDFPYYLLSISAGGENQGQKIAAATYLKNFTRKSVEGDVSSSKPKVSKGFKDQLLRALLQSEPAVVKVLVEVFRVIVTAEFVTQNWWPELVPDLRAALENSNLISGANSQWITINALRVLHALVRPFQYFLEATVSKEPVPPQLEQIAKDILVPLLTLFHQIVHKALATHDMTDMETETFLLIVCKCMYFTVRSHMPSALVPLLPLFCHDLIGILGSLSFDCVIAREDGYQMRLKTGKRCLRIFCSLITRHRKYSDKLMPDMIKCALDIVKYSKNISKLDFLSERIISLCFDVISHVLETGPGWRLVSPHFSYLLESAIFPALVVNEKDISEWEEDPEEYIRKNLPSDLEEISGWREDLFTARKSAMNLLGVISVSKGPHMGNSTNASKRKKGEKKKRNNQTSSVGELLVLPFLSKFPVPSDAHSPESRIMNDYFGVLMAYAGLLDFLREREPTHAATLVLSRLLPLYSLSVCPPLLAAANWVLGELASCLPEDMSADVYSSLLKALAMPNSSDTSCYPVRVSAAAAIVALLDNDYQPPEWLPLLQVVVGRIGGNEEENSVLFQLLSSVVETGNEKVAVHIPYIISSLVVEISKSLPRDLEPWPQMPSPPAPPVPQHSVIEGIGSFISEAVLQYPSATWRACSCIHLLLHVPRYTSETESVKQSLAAAFCQASFSHFREVNSKPGSLWKPLLFAISSCYLCCPEAVDSTLEKDGDGDGGFETWVAALGLVSTNSFKPGLSRESEIKLIAVTLAKVVERLVVLGKSGALLQGCFTSLMEASVRYNEVDDEDNNEDGEEDMDDEDDDGEIEDGDNDDDEDSEDEHEETEQEFLERYAEAALALENDSVIEEGDIEDEDQDIDFEKGCLEELDLQEVVTSLLKNYHPIVIGRQEAYPPELISRFVEWFRDCKIFFQQYSR